MRNAIAIAALVLVVGAGRAAADPIAAAATPGHNNVIGEMDGWSGANLYLTGGPSSILLEFLGHEAGWINTFNFGGNPVEFQTTGPGIVVFNHPRPSALFPSVAPGLLNFTLATVAPAASAGTVANGANVHPDDLGTPNFFVTFNQLGTQAGSGTNPMSGQSVIIAFDDGGAGPDDNHDDLVVRLSIVSGGGTFTVPEGGSTLTLALVGLGLIGLASMRRKYAL